MDKIKIHDLTSIHLNSKINELELVLKESLSAVADGDSKSSAGDKHETSVSMAQLEQEKLSNQLQGLIHLKHQLNTINPSVQHTIIQTGSLIETNNGWYYLSVAIGMVFVNDFKFYCISPDAPISQLLKGKRVNEFVEFNKKKTTIKSIL